MSHCFTIEMKVAVVNLIEVFAKVLERHIENTIVSTQGRLSDEI